MAETMIASEVKPMTDGQIETAVNKVRDSLRKHRSEISSDVAQQVLGLDNLGMMMFAPFRQQAEMLGTMIIRRVKPDRSRAPQAVLDATGRKQYTDGDVVAAMPRGEGDEVDVVFFKLDLKGGWIRDADLDAEYEKRGLKPADPYSQSAVNEADPAFADEHPNGTHWKDSRGRWCYAAFGRWGGGRSVGVRRSGGDWDDDWWFAGLRK